MQLDLQGLYWVPLHVKKNTDDFVIKSKILVESEAAEIYLLAEKLRQFVCHLNLNYNNS